MTVKEIMERAGTNQTGRAVAYIKDALDELNIISETHTATIRMDINQNQRFYKIPKDCLKILDIRCKHYNNEDEKYRSIPRSTYEPVIVDENGR
tara:strand:- start:239 stop:520 length:282 start_codon:yes stop_codon:yes gene_type:complete